MTEKERLTELIRNAPKIEFPFGSRAQGKTYQTAQNMADHLLANGVIVPPCKVGQTLYVLSTCHDIVAFPENGVICPYENVCRIDDCTSFGDTLRPFPMTVEIISIGDHGIYSIFFEESKTEYLSTDFGRDIFITHEEAEKALAGRRATDGKP